MNTVPQLRNGKARFRSGRLRQTRARPSKRRCQAPRSGCRPRSHCDGAVGPQSTHPQNDGLDDISGAPQGLPQQQGKWSSEEDGYKKEETLSKPPVAYNFCRYLFTRNMFPSFRTQHPDFTLGKLVLLDSLAMS